MAPLVVFVVLALFVCSIFVGVVALRTLRTNYKTSYFCLALPNIKATTFLVVLLIYL